jgi:hypothetical protein
MRLLESSQTPIGVEQVHANMAYLMNYCLDCEWSVSAENHTGNEQSELVIEHAIETNHDIDSEYQDGGEPATEWADEWPPTE